MAEYPFIVLCKDCGSYHVPVPLEEMPMDFLECMEIIQSNGKCVTCDSENLFLTQSPEAYKWYDEKVRK